MVKSLKCGFLHTRTITLRDCQHENPEFCNRVYHLVLPNILCRGGLRGRRNLSEGSNEDVDEDVDGDVDFELGGGMKGGSGSRSRSGLIHEVDPPVDLHERGLRGGETSDAEFHGRLPRQVAEVNNDSLDPFFEGSHIFEGTLPMVFALHGFGNDAKSMNNFAPFADSSHSVLVFPEGIKESFNAGDCCGYAKDNDIDDVAFLISVKAQLNVEFRFLHPTLSYGVGWSNGAFLLTHALQKSPDIFRAIAPISGHYTNDYFTSLAGKGVAVMMHHSFDDSFVRPSGCCANEAFPKCHAYGFQSNECVSVLEAFDKWSNDINFCGHEAKKKGDIAPERGVIMGGSNDVGYTLTYQRNSTVLKFENMISEGSESSVETTLTTSLTPLHISHYEPKRKITCQTASSQDCIANTTLCMYTNKGHFDTPDFENSFFMQGEVMEFFAHNACTANGGVWIRNSASANLKNKCACPVSRRRDLVVAKMHYGGIFCFDELNEDGTFKALSSSPESPVSTAIEELNNVSPESPQGQPVEEKSSEAATPPQDESVEETPSEAAKSQQDEMIVETSLEAAPEIQPEETPKSSPETLVETPHEQSIEETAHVVSSPGTFQSPPTEGDKNQRFGIIASVFFVVVAILGVAYRRSRKRRKLYQQDITLQQQGRRGSLIYVERGGYSDREGGGGYRDYFERQASGPKPGVIKSLFEKRKCSDPFSSVGGSRDDFDESGRNEGKGPQNRRGSLGGIVDFFERKNSMPKKTPNGVVDRRKMSPSRRRSSGGGLDDSEWDDHIPPYFYKSNEFQNEVEMVDKNNNFESVRYDPTIFSTKRASIEELDETDLFDTETDNVKSDHNTSVNELISELKDWRDQTEEKKSSLLRKQSDGSQEGHFVGGAYFRKSSSQGSQKKRTFGGGFLRKSSGGSEENEKGHKFGGGFFRKASREAIDDLLNLQEDREMIKELQALENEAQRRLKLGGGFIRVKPDPEADAVGHYSSSDFNQPYIGLEPDDEADEGGDDGEVAVDDPETLEEEGLKEESIESERVGLKEEVEEIETFEKSYGEISQKTDDTDSVGKEVKQLEDEISWQIQHDLDLLNEFKSWKEKAQGQLQKRRKPDPV